MCTRFNSSESGHTCIGMPWLTPDCAMGAQCTRFPLPYAYKERTKRNVEDELAPTKVRTRGSCVPPARFRTRPLLVSVHLPVCPFFCPFRTFQLKLAEQKLLGWDKKFTGCAAHVSMCMGPFIGSSTGPALV